MLLEEGGKICSYSMLSSVDKKCDIISEFFLFYEFKNAGQVNDELAFIFCDSPSNDFVFPKVQIERIIFSFRCDFLSF
jgi:hypothetical protein